MSTRIITFNMWRILPLVVVPLLVSGMLAHWLLSDVLLRRGHETIHGHARSHALRITSIWNELLRIEGLITSRTQLRLSLLAFDQTGKAEHQQKVERIINDAKGSIDHLLGIAIRDTHGTEIAAVGEQINGQQLRLPFVDEQDTPVYVSLDQSGRLVLHFEAKLQLDGTTIGNCRLDVAAEILTDPLADRTGLGKNAEVMLLIQSAQERGHAHHELVVINGPDGRRVSFDDHDALTEQALDLLVVADPPNLFSLQNADRRLLAAMSSPAPGTTLIVTEHERELLAPLTTVLVWFYGIIATVACLTGVLTWRLSSLLAKPLQALAADAIRIQNGEINSIGRQGNIVEIDSVITTLDDLLSQLLQERSRLADEVERQTAELVIASETDKERLCELQEAHDRATALLKELARSNSDLDEFTQIISHDLKEPLRSISSYAALLKDDYGELLDQDGLQYIDRQMELCKRMAALISDLHYYSRAGRAEQAQQKVNLNELLEQVSVMHQDYLREHGAQIEVPDLLPQCVCDPTRIGEVLKNLIVNGIKYNDSVEKIINITSSTQGSGADKIVTIAVSDNGIGINEAHQSKIFKMFRRLHEPGIYGGGTGTGLALCKQIIEKQGGQLWVESMDGSGTTFFFTLSSPTELPEDPETKGRATNN